MNRLKAFFPYQGEDCCKQTHRGRPVKRVIAVRKKQTYIAKGRTTEQCVHKGMQENVSIGMGDDLKPRISYGYPTEHQGASVTVPVYVVAHADYKMP